MCSQKVTKKRLQNIYCIVIFFLIMGGYGCLYNVAWYQIVLAAASFMTAGMACHCLADTCDKENDEEDEHGF